MTKRGAVGAWFAVEPAPSPASVAGAGRIVAFAKEER